MIENISKYRYSLYKYNNLDKDSLPSTIPRQIINKFPGSDLLINF